MLAWVRLRGNNTHKVSLAVRYIARYSWYMTKLCCFVNRNTRALFCPELFSQKAGGLGVWTRTFRLRSQVVAHTAKLPAKNMYRTAGDGCTGWCLTTVYTWQRHIGVGFGDLLQYRFVQRSHVGLISFLREIKSPNHPVTRQSVGRQATVASVWISTYMQAPVEV